MNKLPAHHSIFLLAALLLPLTACRKAEAPAPSGSLLSRVLFTGAGTYDAGADKKTREGGALRQVVWSQKPPLPAQKVTVLYDGNQRVQAWKMTLQQPSFNWESLTKGSRVKVTPRGRITVLSIPELKDAALWQEGESWNLETRGFVTQYDPELLRMLGP